METTTQTPNERLKRYMKENGLVQKDVAAKAEISDRMLSRIVCGNRRLTSRTCKKICAALNLSEKWLQTGQGEELGGMVRENWALEQMALTVLAGGQYAF